MLRVNQFGYFRGDIDQNDQFSCHLVLRGGCGGQSHWMRNVEEGSSLVAMHCSEDIIAIQRVDVLSARGSWEGFTGLSGPCRQGGKPSTRPRPTRLRPILTNSTVANSTVTSSTAANSTGGVGSGRVGRPAHAVELVVVELAAVELIAVELVAVELAALGSIRRVAQGAPL